MNLFVSLVFLAVVVTSSHALCPIGWLTEAGHCFYLSHTELSWPDATEMCRDFGASLFTFTNDSRVRLLLTRLMGHHNRAITYKQIWVGGTDEVQEGKWLWILETGGLPQQLPVDTFHAEHVSHNSISRNCLSMRAAGDSFTWYADECTDRNYYLCEIMNGAAPAEVTVIG